MKRIFQIVICLTLAFWLGQVEANACTNVIVTKGASKDGSCMVTYSADSHQLYGELYHVPAAVWPKGSKMEIYEWDSGKYLGLIDQVERTFQTVGNMNEHQLIIAETTFGGRRELANPHGIMDYGSLIYVTLQRARTAREAIKTIDEFLQTYGFPSDGETFSIADKDECWIMEIVGKGEELGAVWVAIRIPDGYINAHANQSRIHKFPLDDPENCLYAPDVISFARSKGYFTGKDEDFSFCDAYAPADWGALRGCEARVWAAFNILGKGTFDADNYLDFAFGHNPDNKMPLYIKPTEKVGVKELADVMRDHFEDTPMDFRYDVGAGPHEIPYRWRPMGFQVDGVTYRYERSIATQQTGFWFVAQSRGWLPDEIGGVIWFGVDDAATSVLTPIYTSVTEVPECFRVGNGGMTTYSPTSAFWLFNKVTHFAYLFYNRVEPVLRAEIDAFELGSLELVKESDAKALKMLEAGNRGQAIASLTEFSVKRSEQLFNRWKELEEFLLIKFIDGNIKQQNEDGTFKDNGSGKGIPARPINDIPRERWLRAIVKDHGEVMKVGR